MNILCDVCNKEFKRKTGNQKLCSIECRSIFYKNKEKLRYEKSFQTSRKTSICKICNKEFNYHYRPERGERVFCGRSCSSKFHIQKGNFDKWRLRKNPTTGEMKKCLNKNCFNEVYLTQKLINTGKGKLCSFKCEKEYFSYLFKGDKNPFWKKSHTEENNLKRKATLEKNYPGITNAFSLSKRRTKTKPQVSIFNYLYEKFPELNFQIEKRVYQDQKEYYADIVSFDKNLIIEFNGDYWHCNPETYSENFYHHVKKKTAKEIWEEDLKRSETIESLGYKILVVWEKQYKKELWKELLNQWVEENAKENNINVIRPSVNNYSSADVKLGELLGSYGTTTTSDLETENATVEKVELYNNQQPSS